MQFCLSLVVLIMTMLINIYLNLISDVMVLLDLALTINMVFSLHFLLDGC